MLSIDKNRLAQEHTYSIMVRRGVDPEDLTDAEVALVNPRMHRFILRAE